MILADCKCPKCGNDDPKQIGLVTESVKLNPFSKHESGKRLTGWKCLKCQTTWDKP